MDYVISDIHGCSKTLRALIDSLHLTVNDTVYFLGDYVDRGPDSKGVLDIVMNLPIAVCHKGNHEDMMLFALDHPENDAASYHWGINGGKAAMDSFGGTVPEKYLAFLRGLRLITELPDFYLCHAGISPNPMATPEEVLLWDRSCRVDMASTGGRRLICGHTPTCVEVIKESIIGGDSKIIIDAGCVFSHVSTYGNLAALRLDDMALFTQKNIDNVVARGPF
jgi:serine/threonine protein phosphatase 1